jgi:hypothetical protein
LRRLRRRRLPILSAKALASRRAVAFSAGVAARSLASRRNASSLLWSAPMLRRPRQGTVLREDHDAGMASAFWRFVALLLKKSKVQIRFCEPQAKVELEFWGSRNPQRGAQHWARSEARATQGSHKVYPRFCSQQPLVSMRATCIQCASSTSYKLMYVVMGT